MSKLADLRGKLSYYLRYRPLAELKVLLNLDAPILGDDRRVLEQEILPYFSNRPGIEKVLFVGCEVYTKHYEKFFKSQEYWTIEPDSKRRRYGAKLHIVDRLEKLEDHFESPTFDLILCNGVIGFGVNSLPQIRRALEQCVVHLRKNGILVLGYNDSPDLLPCSLDSLQSLATMQPYYLEPIRSNRIVTESWKHHTYACYQKI